MTFRHPWMLRQTGNWKLTIRLFSLLAFSYGWHTCCRKKDFSGTPCVNHAVIARAADEFTGRNKSRQPERIFSNSPEASSERSLRLRVPGVNRAVFPAPRKCRRTNARNVTLACSPGEKDGRSAQHDRDVALHVQVKQSIRETPSERCVARESRGAH